MLRTITATICLHPILLATELPHSVYGIDFAVPYCGECTKSRKIAAELEAADRKHKLLEETKELSGDRQELCEARIRYNKGHLAHLAHHELQIQCCRDDHDHGVSPGGGAAERPISLDTILKVSAIPRPKKNLIVRFESIEDFRQEEEYRSQSSFDRTDPHYEPGLHADDSGNGFFNTSNPYASDSSSGVSELSSENSGDSSDQEMEGSSDQEMEDLFGVADEDESDEEMALV